MDRCATEEPPFTNFGPGHEAACHLYDQAE